MSEFTAKTFAGINNRKEADRIESGWVSSDLRASSESGVVELATGSNIDITDSNELQTRSGTLTKIAGVYTSLWAGEDIALAVSDGVMYRIWPDFTTEELCSGVGATVKYLQINDRVYWSDGITTGVVDRGAARSWGLVAPTITNVSEIAGDMPAGTYQVAITGVRSDWQESGSGLTHTIDISDGSGIRINWSASADVRDVNIYISTQNGTVLYFADTTEAVDAQYDFKGGILGRILDTQWLEPPQPCQCMATYRGIIYTAVGSFLFASNPLGYELFDMRDYLAIDGYRITMVADTATGLFIGTELGLYFLKGNALEDFELQSIKTAPVVYGSEVFADGFDITGKQDLSGKAVVIFATGSGFVLGFDDGIIVDIGNEAYELTTGTRASAVFRGDPNLHQYLLFQQ